MHEVGLMQTALDIASRHAAAAGASRIARLTMRVGKLSGASPDALRFAFEVLSAGTAAEGAVFEIDEVPLVCRCANCARDFEPEDLVFICPECGMPTTEVLSGRELDVAQLEVI